MKKNLLAVLALSLSTWMPCQAQSPEIVVVDMQKVFENYSVVRVQDQDLQEEVKRFRDQFGLKLKALEADNQAFAALRRKVASQDLTAEELKELSDKATELYTSLREREQALQQEDQAFKQDVEARAARARRELVESVNDHVANMARERNWNLVLDSSATTPAGLKVVPFRKNNLDMTQEVIDSLNKAAAMEAARENQDGETAEETTEEPAE